jgi:hypothetical protein
MYPRLLAAPAALGLVLLLSACGGGSAVEGTGPLVLSATNHVAAGQAALATGLQFEESRELIVGAEVRRASDGALLSLALAALRRVDAILPATPSLATGVVVTRMARCDNDAGSYTLAIDDADHDNRFGAGDTATFTFNDCVLDGDRANGKVAIRVRSLTGALDTPVHDGRLTVTMTSLALTGASGSYTGEGTLDVDLVGTAARTGSTRVATASFSASGRFGGTTSTRTIGPFSVQASHVPEGAGERRSIRFEGRLSSTGLGGRSIDIVTVQPFVIAGGARHPSQGQALVTGAGAGVLRVTALDATQVRFDLDADGDGVFEASGTRAWSDLL